MNYTIAQDSRIGGREINQDRVAWLATDDAVLLAQPVQHLGGLFGQADDALRRPGHGCWASVGLPRHCAQPAPA